MSKFRAAALGAAVVIGLAVQAGAQVPAKPDTANRGMREGDPRRQLEGPRRGKIGSRRGAKLRRGPGAGKLGRGAGQGRLMADLNLTDVQRTRIRAIQDKYQQQFRALRDQSRTQFRAMQDARQKSDSSAATRQRFAQQREQVRQRALAIRQQQQNEIRALLTAEQRTRWDAAAQHRKQRSELRREGMKSRRGMRIKT